MEALITLLPGDGIGPEVTSAAHRVLKEVAAKYGHGFEYKVELIGGAAIDATGDPLPAQTIASCESSDAVFLGAVGGPKWSDPNIEVRPEQGLLKIRSLLGLYANLRPVKVIEDLIPASPLRAELLTGVDMIVVRELTGGIYFGEKTRSDTMASDLCTYHVHEVERIVRVAARLASARRGKLCSVDKANVLETSRLWRDVTNRLVPGEFPELDLETLLVDAAAMHLLSRPLSVMAHVEFTSQYMDQLLISQDRTLPTPAVQLPAQRYCCGTVLGWMMRRMQSRQPSARRSAAVPGRPILLSMANPVFRRPP
jgi:3-isopropylmalate dehydrogenase